MSDKPREKKAEKPETPAPAAVPTVGALLRQRRQMRGQSLEAVHQATRIPRQLLQAIEEDRHGDFAAPVYLHGFLKSYCEHLELDYLPLWQRIAPSDKPASEEEGEDSGPDFSHLASPSVMPLLVLGGLLAVGVAAWGVSRVLAARKAAPAAEAAVHAPAVQPDALASAPTAAFMGPVSSPTAASVAPEAPAALPPAPAVSYPARLRITATAAGQVSLRRDGRLVFEGRLPPGKYLDFRGSSFVVVASNPKGLRIDLGGQSVDLAARTPEPDGSYRLGQR
jgi:cytoskeleton protein RodZ